MVGNNVKKEDIIIQHMQLHVISEMEYKLLSIRDYISAAKYL